MSVSLIVRVEELGDGLVVRLLHGGEEDVTPVIEPHKFLNTDHHMFLRKFSANAADAKSKRVKRRVKRQEVKFAQDVGGRTQPGSGNQGYAKGDVRAPYRLRGECKSTSAKSATITREVLDKIRRERTYPEIPAVDVSFVNDKDNHVEDRWLMIPYEDAMQLLQKAWEADNAARDD